MNKPIIDNSVTGARSRQNTSCNWTGSADFGRIVPFHIEELVPTDKVITCKPRIELQMLPIASPTFGKLDIYCHYFFVPLRLCWEGSSDFFARQGVLKNSTPPYITLKQLYDFYQTLPAGSKRGMYKHWTSLGLPPFFEESTYTDNTYSALNSQKITLLKFRAYQQIWWDFYRDPEVLRDESKNDYININSGAWSSTGAYALPNQNVLAPKVRTIKDCWIANLFTSSGQSPLEDSGLKTTVAALNTQTSVVASSAASRRLRKIEALTRLSERLSLAGKRQIDALFAAYGVKPEFNKLQMAQYIGGAKSTVLVSDITSSADTVQSLASGSDTFNGGMPLGAKAASGYAQLSDLNINYTASEAGYLVGLVSIMPHIHFNQGIDKSWFRNGLEDFFMKQLERTGQVAVACQEIGMRSSNSPNYVRSNDQNTFAFTQPYYEYKMGRDILAGDFAKYHNASTTDAQNNVIQTIKYMQSMEMYVDYPLLRQFDADSLKVSATPFNKIFYYLGGGVWSDSDDHFHLCIDKEVVKDSPMDGYAVPTLETTKEPHEASASIGGDTVL